MNGATTRGIARGLKGLLTTAVLSMVVTVAPLAAEPIAQPNAASLYEDGSVLPLSAHGEALLGFLGPLPTGLASDDLAKAVLAAGSSTERNPFGLLVRFTESASAVEVVEVLGAVGGSLTGPSLDGAGLYLVETLRDLDAALVVLGRSPVVKWAGPDAVLSVADLPSDPRLDELWGLTGANGIDAPGAWAHSLGDPSVVVAVIDTGVDLDHPDLAANIWTNSGEIAGNGIDDDGNGYIDDLHGWDFVNDDSDPNDDHNHGTHVAGTIAGVANDIGVVGVAPGVQIMALKFLSASGGGYSSDAVSALSYAIANGASISNNSWGGGGSSGAMSGMLDQAAAADHLFVAAAGNSNSDNDTWPTYPASYPQDIVLTVASTQIDGNRSSFSNYGELGVDVAAPGSAILSTVFGGGYATYSGTSMATPHVVGVAALVRSVAPGLTALQVKERLIDSSTWVDALSTVSGSGGRVDAAAAVGASVPAAPAVSIAVPEGTITEGSPVNLLATATGSDGTDLSSSVTWTDSAGTVLATGASFDWTPQVHGVQRIRAAASAGGLSGLDAVFLDVQEVQRSLTLTAPNGGEAFLPGDEVVVEWTTEGPVGGVDVSIERRAQVSEEFAGDEALPIIDHQTLDIPLVVSDAGDIGTVELGLRLAHTYDADLQISLVHPDGTTVSLAFGVGSWRNDFGEGAADCSGTLTVFADDADTAIDEGTAPFAGRHRPADALSVFTGKSATGTWTLRIHDRWSWDQGEVYCADLSISSEIAEVATGIDPAVGSATWVVPDGGVEGPLMASVVAGSLSDRSDAWFTAAAPPPTLPPCSATTTAPPESTTTSSTTTTTAPPESTTTTTTAPPCVPPSTTTLPPTTTSVPPESTTTTTLPPTTSSSSTTTTTTTTTTTLPPTTTAPPPSLEVKAPNGGESFARGEQVLIDWSAINVEGDVDILVRRAGIREEESPGASALPIEDYETIVLPFEVDGTGTVEVIEVGLRLDHTYTADLEISLVAPDDESVRLAFHNGGWRNDFGSGADDCSGTLTVFADDAVASIDSGTAPFAGRHRPYESMAALAGQSMEGTWRIEITDHWGWDQGSLYCAQLTVFGESTTASEGIDAGVGSYAWTPPEDLLTGDFLVEVAGLLSDRSDGTFHVEGASPPTTTTTTTLPPTTTTTTTLPPTTTTTTTLPPTTTTTTTLPPTTTTTTLPPTTTTTTTLPPTTDVVVSTGYTADEYAGIANAAAILGMDAAEFQRTGVYVVSFLTAISPTPPEPLRPRPPVNGPQLLASVWSEEELPMLMATAEAWGLTPEELQKFGAILLAFFVGLAYG